jgi:competence ComEA-like helix-hairpin-helix protein
MAMGTRWFDLSGRELRVLAVAAAIILLTVLALAAARSALWKTEFEVRDARETLRVPTPVDINSAPAYELQLLKGIGEKTAAAIVQERETNGPFRGVDDLKRVHGIGDKTLEELRPHVMCVPPKERSRPQ